MKGDLLNADPLTFADGAQLLRAYIAIGVPIDKDGVFFGEQGHPISATYHGIQLGGSMVDHYELDFIGN